MPLGGADRPDRDRSPEDPQTPLTDERIAAIAKSAHAGECGCEVWFWRKAGSICCPPVYVVCGPGLQRFSFAGGGIYVTLWISFFSTTAHQTPFPST